MSERVKAQERWLDAAILDALDYQVARPGEIAEDVGGIPVNPDGRWEGYWRLTPNKVASRLRALQAAGRVRRLRDGSWEKRS